jgi:hypothetical protein
MTTVDTVGRWSNQLIAICGIVVTVLALRAGGAAGDVGTDPRVVHQDIEAIFARENFRGEPANVGERSQVPLVRAHRARSLPPCLGCAASMRASSRP